MFKLILPFYNNLSIAKKLRFIGLSSAFIAGAIILSSLYIFQYISEKEIVVEESTVFANILAENVAPSIISKDILGISNILASVEYNKKIHQTFALDESWNMLGAFHKGDNFVRQRKIIPIIKENKNLWNDGYFYAVVPIVNDNIEIGNLVIVASLDDFYFRMLQYTFVIVIIFLIAIYITAIFRKSLQNSILEPIAKLDNITTQIIKTKNLEHEIPSFNSDEIGDLAKNFQYMISELSSYHTELNKQKSALTYQASYDSLTKLPNRVLFQDRLKQSIRKSSRNSEKFALFFIDLDKFKEVNDTLGHEYGDKLLVKVAQRLSSIIREDDTLARLGGDEFIVIMNNIKEFHTASVLAQKILDILEVPLEVENEDIFISCSIGISLYPQDSRNEQELLKYADIAMYRSKHEGRANYHFYVEEMNKEVIYRSKMQSDIRRALEEKEFIVYYQPQYSIETDRVIGLEALVRWKDGDKLVAPDKFLPFAEELGMVVAINRQVMYMAMKQAKSWHNDGLYFGRLSINISIEQVEDKNFIGLVQSLLYETQCSPTWITLELTEGQLMKNPKTAIAILEQLKSLGILIAVDDFGTGYSSLSYLKHLPISELKIDRSFIVDIPNSEDDMAIVESIIAIAKTLKLDLIAEGVESEEQKEFLLSKGCTRVQGFLYAKPMPVDMVSEYLSSYLDNIPVNLA
ncbi:MAG: EAL domain-containing protein [Campylobacterota bacterium]|nr:EAL domain-containing protein [Campylobacterota bacterium]